MTSKKQWLLLTVAFLYGFISVTGGLPYRLGGGFGVFIVAYALVLGYNGISLTGKVKHLLSRQN